MRPKYLFGDSDVAARRLELLARVFEPSTRAFLREAAGDQRFKLVFDLGCGPGFTTHLIAETLGCSRVIGLDSSPRFIQIAKQTASAAVSFEQHDVCAAPFPGGKADLIFCRYLLSHLENPAVAVGHWAAQINRGGLLLIEEVERIGTSNPAFAAYTAIVEALLSYQRNSLYAGRIAAALEPPERCVRECNGVRKLAVKNRDAAQMFVLNMQAWKNSDYIRDHYTPENIAELEEELQRIARGESSIAEIEWSMRQVAFRRV